MEHAIAAARTSVKKISFSGLKKFRDEVTIPIFEDLTLFVGPNNSGKTTALQAFALWQFLIQRWREKGGGRKDRGVVVSRGDLLAIPIRDASFLWHNTKVQTPASAKIPIEVKVFGETDGETWEYGFRIKNQSSETFTFVPMDFAAPLPDGLLVNYLPPLSGVEKEEPEYGNDEKLEKEIGQGLPGEVLRNILLRVYQSSPDGKWVDLQESVRSLFGIKLLPIRNTTEIIAEYHTQGWDRRGASGLDLNTLGSGALQFILVAAFAFWRPSGLLLLDEPDSHEHVFLQREVFAWLRELAQRTGKQIVISTHSETFIQGSEIQKVIGFFPPRSPEIAFGHPERILRQLSRVSHTDAIHAYEKKFILFTEDYTDRDILSAWSKVLGRPIDFTQIFTKETGQIGDGKRYQEAREIFFKPLKDLVPDLRGLMIFDGDAKRDGEPEKPEALEIVYWEKTEIENYLLEPSAIMRFLLEEEKNDNLFGRTEMDAAQKFLDTNLPALLEVESGVKGSAVLASLFRVAYPGDNRRVPKSRYHDIAAQMRPEDIPSEAQELIEKIHAYAALAKK